MISNNIMISNNMNYRYNVEYYDGLIFSGKDFDVEGMKMKARTNDIVEFSFMSDDIFLSEIGKMKSVQSFELRTAYPGLMIGIGALHEIKMKDTLKNGFTFDYVTGLPYLPGSSLKGILRSYFPQKGKKDQATKEEYIKFCLGDKEIEIYDFIKWAFGDNDDSGEIRFIGAFPVFKNKEQLLSMEYITPHKNKFENPKPISMVKIKPDILFRFLFSFTDYKVGERVILSTADITRLFKRIILDMGIGAKTNVGFGVMVEKNVKPLPNTKENSSKESPANDITKKEDITKTGGKRCSACGKSYKIFFNGVENKVCPFCQGKGNKKSNGNKNNWRW